MRSVSKLLKAASVAAIAVAALSLSATDADAKPRHKNKNHDRHGHRACSVRHTYAAPVYRHSVVYVPRPMYVAAPHPVYIAPAPVFVPAPYPVAGVVYDRHRDGVDGFIGVSGRHVSIGIGF